MEIVNYVIHGASLVTPQSVRHFRQSLPELMLKNTLIDPKEFPHLHAQVEFLIQVFEDVADGDYEALPYVAFAETLFALHYVHKGLDLIPDHIPGIGFADDSSVIRAVLMRNEKAFSRYAEAKSLNWNEITSQP